MGFDKKVCKELGVQVEAALKEAFKDSGFDMAYTGGRFEDLEFILKVKVTLTDGETKSHKDYREYAKDDTTRLPANMLDATFDYGKEGNITVIGWLPNRPTMNILFRNAAGKERIAPQASVIRAFERSL